MKEVNLVLLVDDDPMFNMINEKIIQVSKFARHVKSYVNPNTALAFLRDSAMNNKKLFPDVIFLDINMSEINGWEFLDSFNLLPRDLIKNTCVFLLTSSNDKQDMERAVKYKNICNVILKPLTVDKMVVLSAGNNLPEA